MRRGNRRETHLSFFAGASEHAGEPLQGVLGGEGEHRLRWALSE